MAEKEIIKNSGGGTPINSTKTHNLKKFWIIFGIFFGTLAIATGATLGAVFGIAHKNAKNCDNMTQEFAQKYAEHFIYESGYEIFSHLKDPKYKNSNKEISLQNPLETSYYFWKINFSYSGKKTNNSIVIKISSKEKIPTSIIEILVDGKTVIKNYKNYEFPDLYKE